MSHAPSPSSISDPLISRLTPIPVLIFFAKQEELSYAEHLFRSSDLCTFAREPLTDLSGVLKFYLGTLHVDYLHPDNHRPSGQVEFYVACGLQQGPETAAAVVSHIMTKYQPQFAISLGICAGLQDVKIHDVLFATGAVNYEAGKMNPEGTFDLDHHWVYADRGITNEVKSFVKKDKTKPYHEGYMLTGSAVRKDATSLFQKIRDRVGREVKGLDMEASAFLRSCEICGVKAMPVIKSISDMGDEKKSDATYQESVENATRAGLEFLKQYFSKQDLQKYWKKK